MLILIYYYGFERVKGLIEIRHIVGSACFSQRCE